MARKPTTSRNPRRERGSISAEEIVDGAFRLAEKDGIEALSMPRLARSLGIGVTSIYWYFKNKDELVEAVTVEAARRFHDLIKPGPTESWQAHVKALYYRLRTALCENELLCDLLYMRGHRLNERALLNLYPDIEDSMGKLVAAGFSAERALQFHVVLSLYTRGSVVLERQMRKAGVSTETSWGAPDAFPLVAGAARLHNIRGVGDEAFVAQLDLIVASMESYLERQQHPAAVK